eukprot:10104239-Lingulodinium_polyedra.AAC.1
MAEVGAAFTSWATEAVAIGSSSTLFRWIKGDYREVPVQCEEGPGPTIQVEPEAIMKAKHLEWSQT